MQAKSRKESASTGMIAQWSAREAPEPHRPACPCCGALGAQGFYSVPDVPAQDVRQFHTRADAVACVRGDIDLRSCPECGFIWNAAFREALVDYSDQYESTQSASATFSRFQLRLARDLIERHQIRGKRVVEIGCGQGEFLSVLCREGGNEGLGYDPAYRGGAAETGIEIRPDLFKEEDGALEADLLCCKMTLEHIPEVSRFLSMLRRALEGRRETVLFLQIPEVGRILRECAFWDIYYEHCSYFGAAALVKALAHAGFETLDLWSDYEDQYLMVTARAAEAPIANRPPPGGGWLPLPDTARFAESVSRDQAGWRRLIDEERRAGGHVALWGGGAKAVSFLTSLKLGDRVPYAVDVNPRKHGTFIAGGGQEIIAPQRLVSWRPDLVIVMNSVYREEIERSLSSMDLTPRLLTVEAGPHQPPGHATNGG